MKEFDVYFQIYGKGIKKRVWANNKKEVEQIVRSAIQIDKIEDHKETSKKEYKPYNPFDNPFRDIFGDIFK